MSGQRGDRTVLQHIQELASEEERLYEQAAISDADEARLKTIAVELDQCWDLLRQRRALRDAGRNPGEARVRPAGIVEKYEG